MKTIFSTSYLSSLPYLTIICLIAAVLPASEPPRVLLIGDSISAGYKQTVQKALENKAVIIRARDNGGSTSKSLSKPKLPKNWVDPEAVEDPENPSNQKKKKRKIVWPTNAAGKVPTPTDYDTNLDYYLAHGPFDIIHFNWGLHDLKNGGIGTELYLKNLSTLVERMKQDGAILIFATTTPVPEVNSARRIPATVPEYNQAAIDLLKQQGVLINDLYATMLPHQESMQLNNNVHFTKEGYSLLGTQVAQSIRKAIPLMGKAQKP